MKNYLGYLKLWWLTEEHPPKQTLLIGTRKPTNVEVEYGKQLEVLAYKLLGRD